MICPNCKCEYIRGVTQCADCGAALVDELDPHVENPATDVRLVSIWQGNDPAEGERIKDALEKADIPFTVPDSKSSFSFLHPESILEIWITDADRERARKILLDLDGHADWDELSPEEIESLALPESDQLDNEDQKDSPPDFPDDWHEDDPIAEVWNGDKEELADTLRICLREIGIGSRKISEASHWRLVVRPEQETRAREVVREVVEARPPE
jgi:hypothetical protein